MEYFSLSFPFPLFPSNGDIGKTSDFFSFSAVEILIPLIIHHLMVSLVIMYVPLLVYTTKIIHSFHLL